MVNIDFGKLSEEETIRIFRQALAELDVVQIIAALKADLEADDRAEIVAQLELGEAQA